MRFYTNDELQPVINNLDGVSIGVFLTYKEESPQRNFRCCNCGKLVFQYDGSIGMILESSDKPRSTGFTEHLCTRCRMTYSLLW